MYKKFKEIMDMYGLKEYWCTKDFDPNKKFPTGELIIPVETYEGRIPTDEELGKIGAKFYPLYCSDDSKVEEQYMYICALYPGDPEFESFIRDLEKREV